MCVARATNAVMSSTHAKLYSCDTLLQRLAQDLEDMPPELRPFIDEENAVVRPRHLARHGEGPAADQPHIRDRLMRGATRPGGDDGGAPPGEAGDAMDAGRRHRVGIQVGG